MTKDEVIKKICYEDFDTGYLELSPSKLAAFLAEHLVDSSKAVPLGPVLACGELTLQGFPESTVNGGGNWSAPGNIEGVEIHKRWKPKINERYFYVSETGLTGFFYWKDSSFDNALWNLGNCFATEHEATLMRDKIGKLLKQGD